MTPTGWTPVHRTGDDELVGYLVPDAGGTIPLTLSGHPLAGPLEEAEAVALLERRGLAVLAEPWWLDTEDGGFRVQILAARPDRITVVRADHGVVSPDSPRLQLPVPVGDRLRRLG